ncbi:MAG: hypothetical protein M5U12_25460 [Verrucomicrobia bacterium]|nr:hypothetical protein [Verrucomicrobiota bacterium]
MGGGEVEGDELPLVVELALPGRVLEVFEGEKVVEGRGFGS